MHSSNWHKKRSAFFKALPEYYEISIALHNTYLNPKINYK